jgi:hypothetical protein
MAGALECSRKFFGKADSELALHDALQCNALHTARQVTVEPTPERSTCTKQAFVPNFNCDLQAL